MLCRSGVIQEGDRVLAVNGQYLESRTLDQVNLTLRDAGLQCTLHIEFDVAGQRHILTHTPRNA